MSTRADRLLGAITAAALALGAWQGLAALAAPQSRLQLQEVGSVAAVLSGRAAAAVNHIMSHNLPADPWLRATGGVLRWTLFRSGGPQVGVGCDDWLYLTEELRPWPAAEAAMAGRADLVRRVADHLRARGIGLLVVVVPDKARVAGAHLCGLDYSAQARSRYAAFARLLAARGIAQVDLLTAFRAAGQDLYYRTDTHWNQAGAALAAARVADQSDLQPGTASFRTEATGTPAPRAGDLLRLMSLDAVPDLGWPRLRPRPDEEAPERTIAAASAPAPGLLDDAPPVEITLLGSSFSANGNFLGRLRQAFGREVTGFARPGGGFAGAAREYLGSTAFRETPPRLVVWEFPERVLGQPPGRDEAELLSTILTESPSAR
ncbi:Cell division protein FtsQ [Rhodovastum atsumiense]|uniref:Cell division protein FtsQ n=1 Tax=Rhodovastum atsumiense TaxID=504468 RepID=A0A5M6IM50_9PROT|nr:cell division protein FtsQ [Rhodovastum atsumiense]KAA5609321.1 cell division protein FtsQ [Rhodovastum atsumiense]CAH2602382.1 Cell division protein FtsQ [Rhodovastum atsumiense]